MGLENTKWTSDEMNDEKLRNMSSTPGDVATHDEGQAGVTCSVAQDETSAEGRLNKRILPPVILGKCEHPHTGSDGNPLSVNYNMPWGEPCSYLMKNKYGASLAIASWAMSIMLFYFFGLNGPFGRFSIVIQIGIPIYFTLKLILNKSGLTKD